MPPMSRGRSKRTLALVAAAQEILQEIQPCSVRAVAYQLFGRKLIADMGTYSTNSVSRALRIEREQGDIDWAWIVDESREAESTPQWDDLSDFFESVVPQYRRDYWQNQHHRIEVWSEKGTIRGTLAPVLDEYGVTFRVMHGFASATVAHDIAELSRKIDKPFVALYVGDHDPSGRYMSDVDLPKRLAQYGGRVEVRRIALVNKDLKKLPSFHAKTKQGDPRYKWFTREFGTQCYELDALSPTVLRERVKAEIRSYLDIDRWNHDRMLEQAERDTTETIKLRLDQICSGNEDT